MYSEEQKPFFVEMTATPQANQKRVSPLNGYREAIVFPVAVFVKVMFVSDRRDHTNRK